MDPTKQGVVEPIAASTLSDTASGAAGHSSWPTWPYYDPGSSQGPGGQMYSQPMYWPHQVMMPGAFAAPYLGAVYPAYHMPGPAASAPLTGAFPTQLESLEGKLPDHGGLDSGDSDKTLKKRNSFSAMGDLGVDKDAGRPDSNKAVVQPAAMPTPHGYVLHTPGATLEQLTAAAVHAMHPAQMATQPVPEAWRTGQMQAGSMDGNSGPLLVQDERELKRQKRKQSNRESARRSRLRKQAEIERLQDQNKVFEEEIHLFYTTVQRLATTIHRVLPKVRGHPNVTDQEVDSAIMEANESLTMLMRSAHAAQQAQQHSQHDTAPASSSDATPPPPTAAPPHLHMHAHAMQHAQVAAHHHAGQAAPYPISVADAAAAAMATPHGMLMPLDAALQLTAAAHAVQAPVHAPVSHSPPS